MEGKFNDKLDLIWNGKGVEARGPVEWEKDETGAALHIAIMQGTAVATGRTGDDLPSDADEFILAAPVAGGGKLEPGSAIATGWALVRGGEVSMYEWSVPVTLQADKPAGSLTADLRPAGATGGPS
jgi:hypothetical protein